MKLPTLILLVLFLLVPTTLAFNCTLTINPNQCINITNSNINESQKDKLLSALLYNYTKYPNHEFIFNYNTNIKVNSSINNLTIINSTYIKNAWLSLLTVMPSILENNNNFSVNAFSKSVLFVPNIAFVLSEYNYEVYVPENYVSNGYPETLNNDCKTIYTLVENTSNFNVLVNNENQGSLKLNPISINQDSIIKDNLVINTNIKQDNYKWERYCTATRRGRCIRWAYRCIFSSTDYLRDTVNLQDSINVKYYNIHPIVNVNLLDYYHNITKLYYNASNYDRFTISFSNSSYKEQKYTYSLEFTKKPFYIAVLKANKVNIKKAENLIAGLNNTLFVKDINNCKLNSFNHFFSFNNNCNLVLVKEEDEKFEVVKFEYNILDWVRLIVLIFLLYIIYRIGRYYVVRSVEG